MKRAEEVAIFVAAQINIPVILWGPPGQGKSAFCSLGFENLGYFVLTIRTNNIQPHHLGGFPVPSPDGTLVRMVPPSWVYELNEKPKAVLFLDDLSAAPPSNQMAALGLLDEKQICGIKLKAITLAAANFDSVATQRFMLDAAAANRMVHIPVTSDVQRYTEGVINNFPTPTLPVVRPTWTEMVRGKAQFISQFLLSAEGAASLNAMPPEITEKTVAWPSERSWHMVMKCLAACDSIQPDSIADVNMADVRELLFKGCVGNAAYQQFLQSLRKSSKFNAGEALNRGERYDFPEQGDDFHALMWNVRSKVCADPQKHWNNAWALVAGALRTQHRDATVPLITDLIGLGNSQRVLPERYEDSIRRLLDTLAA